MPGTEINQLVHMLKEGLSPYHVVEQVKKELFEAGFSEFAMTGIWNVQNGGCYFIQHHGSSLFAFTIGKNFKPGNPYYIAAAHTDFPCLRIKPNPDVHSSSYAQLNVEVYGGAILNTWLDRPLTVAGRAALRSSDVLKPDMRIFAAKEPLFTIPNLAIHMNRDVNKGIELNKQIDLLPIAAMLQGQEKDAETFLRYLAKSLDAQPEDILEYELSIVNAEQPCLVGLEQEFLSSPRLDNLVSVQALVSGLINGTGQEVVNMIALFDHEEIGSKTKQGAGSLLLRDILGKLSASLEVPQMLWLDSLYESMLLSVDVAHALHPNQPSKMDITNRPVLNGGLCIKEACAQSYATDSEAAAIVQQLCDAYGIPYQKFVNRSDMPGGGTLGSIASSLLPVRTVDIGIPLLAMHSARECMGCKDQMAVQQLVTAYFSVR